MNIDKLIQLKAIYATFLGFGSLMNIDKLIPGVPPVTTKAGFGSLMNIDKLILLVYLQTL